jgi:hypothetical protein
MRWIDRLSRAQRVVVVIAFGLALWAVGTYFLSYGISGYAFSGTGIGPLTPQFYGAGALPPWLHPWVRLVFWLVLIGVWALGSIRVLRPSSGNAASD